MIMKKEDFIKTKIYEDVFNNRRILCFKEDISTFDELRKKHEIVYFDRVEDDGCIFNQTILQKTEADGAIIYKVSHDSGYCVGYIKLEDVNREWRDYQLSELL
jgi:hypothetical protein